MGDVEEVTEVQEEKKEEKIKIRDVTNRGSDEKAKELRFTRTFTMEWDDDGKRRIGEFTVKRATIGDQSRIGTMAASFRQDKPMDSIDNTTANLQEWLATCSVLVTKAPDWWNPSEMFDPSPLQRVYEEALAFHATFRSKSVG